MGAFNIKYSKRSVVKQRDAALLAHHFHVAAYFWRVIDALDHGEIAQQREGDDVFVAEARAEVVRRGDERQQRG